MMRFAVLALSLALSACGFRPLYAPDAAGGPAIGPVIVDQVDGKSGHELKTELDRLFDIERGAGPARRLAITLTESVYGLGFRVDESASRSDVYLSASYVLYDIEGKAVTSGSTYSVASYDIPASTYGELSAQNSARERAATLLAERIRTDLALKLAAKKKTAAFSPAPQTP